MFNWKGCSSTRNGPAPVSLELFTSMHKDSEYDILEIIHGSPETVSQRDLAAAADLSLGMTNAVLKKLVTKGFLVMKRINSRNIRYVLTPEGLAEVVKRSEALLKRTLGNVAEYRAATEAFINATAESGIDAICLKGPSDLDFIVEWACLKKGILYNPKHVVKNILSINQKALLKALNIQYVKGMK